MQEGDEERHVGIGAGKAENKIGIIDSCVGREREGHTWLDWKYLKIEQRIGWFWLLPHGICYCQLCEDWWLLDNNIYGILDDKMEEWIVGIWYFKCLIYSL